MLGDMSVIKGQAIISAPQTKDPSEYHKKICPEGRLKKEKIKIRTKKYIPLEIPAMMLETELN